MSTLHEDIKEVRDLLRSCGCDICSRYSRILTACEEMEKALEFIRGRQSYRDLDETEIARECLRKVRGE